MYPLWSINDVLLTRNRKALATALREFTGRKYDYTPRNAFEERYVHYVSTIEAERIRNQVTLTAIKGLIIKLGGLGERRKAIVLVSEGFTNVLPVQVNDQIATCNGGACGNQPRPRTDPIGGANSPAQQRMESQEFFLQAEMMSDIKMVTDLANRYNCAIYSLDPRGLAPFEFDLSTAGQAAVSLTKDQQMLDTTIDTLRVLADETDGRAIVNSNDLDRGLKQIIRDTSAYYLLGYTSAVTTDGKFHKLNVRVKRPGLQVRSRPGYMAMSATEVERALAPKKPGPPPAITEALGTLAVSAQQRRNPIRTWIGMSPGSDGKTKISFVWNPMPAVPGTRREVAATVSLLAGGAEFGSLPSRKSHQARDGSSSKCRRDRSSSRSRVAGRGGRGARSRNTQARRAEPGPGTDGEHARGVSRAHAAGVADARRRSPGAPGHRARVPPHRSASRSRRARRAPAAHPCSRRGCSTARAERCRSLPVTPAGLRRPESDRRSACGPSTGRFPHRGDRQRRRGADFGAVAFRVTP